MISEPRIYPGKEFAEQSCSLCRKALYCLLCIYCIALCTFTIYILLLGTLNLIFAFEFVYLSNSKFSWWLQLSCKANALLIK